MDYVVTEYGVARLRGKTARERAEVLIGIAHPKFREMLQEAVIKRWEMCIRDSHYEPLPRRPR